mmetsp:Transcript_10009/g.23869  ORF Transcript_10009/g.23869 Transcript_10009/m.23869 type:complete len:211 (+) Transcript_10009:358-990(+)
MSSDQTGEAYSAKQALETDSSYQCSICLETGLTGDKLAVMPCHSNAPSLRYCYSCVEKICRNGFEGKLGKCPTCATWISVDGNNVQLANTDGWCRQCVSYGPLQDPDGKLCNECVLGHSLSLSYECSRCHRLQRIPYPLWKTQQKPDQFGSFPWTCDGECAALTTWRVAKQHLHLIPPELCPPSWGPRESWLPPEGADVQRRFCFPCCIM